MSTPRMGNPRLRSYTRFVLAAIYFFFARILARHGAENLNSPLWAPLMEQAILVLLLVLGYAAMGRMLDGQQEAISAQGLPPRRGWLHESGTGLAVGWSIALVCALAMALGGGIAIVLTSGWTAWGWFLVDIAYFALLTLAEEVAYRGYGFQRFMDSVGPAGAAVGFAAFYAVMQAMLPGTSRVSIAVAVVLNLVLTTAYVRTRALWLSWGINFGWKASRALLFGLAVNGMSNNSPVVQGDPMGPFWLTGGGFGLDGSWFALLVLLATWPVVMVLTRELNYRHNAPVIVPAGIAVDLEAAGRQQHEAATMSPMSGSAGGTAPLVQILPVSGPNRTVAEQPPPDEAVQPK